MKRSAPINMDDPNWTSPQFRRSIVQKIEEALQSSNMPTSKTSVEMENHVFQKAKTKEEYISCIGRVLRHVREMRPMASQIVGLVQSSVQPPSAANLLQTLNQRPSLTPIPRASSVQLQSGVPQQTRSPLSSEVVSVSISSHLANQPMSIQTTSNTTQPASSILSRPTTPIVSTAQIASPVGTTQMASVSAPSQTVQTMAGNVVSAGQSVIVSGGQIMTSCVIGNQMLPNIPSSSQARGVPSDIQAALGNQIITNISNRLINSQTLAANMAGGNRSDIPTILSNIENSPVSANQVAPSAQIIHGSGGNQLMCATVTPSPIMGNRNMSPNPNQVITSVSLPLHGGSGTPMGNVPIPTSLNIPLQNQMTQILYKKHDGIPGQSPFVTLRGPMAGQLLRQAPPQVALLHQPHSPANILPGSMMPPPTLMSPSSSAPQLAPNVVVGPGLRPPSVGSQMTPSPGSVISLNTPSFSQFTPSPSNDDEQAYREKVKQLSKYIEPLRRMIAKMGSEDKDKLSKMSKLLEILSTGQRMPLETLLKCEVVLEKLDFKKQMDVMVGVEKDVILEHHPLLDAFRATLKSPFANHFLRRAFLPAVYAMAGLPLENLPKSLKRKRMWEVPEIISELLQGEIARLDQRFKISLDAKYKEGTEDTHLLCWLDDKQLPSVPPLRIMVPLDYPDKSPRCAISDEEYEDEGYLCYVKAALDSYTAKLPPTYSLSHLLDMWELSTIEARICYKNKDNPDKPSTVDALIVDSLLQVKTSLSQETLKPSSVAETTPKISIAVS